MGNHRRLIALALLFCTAPLVLTACSSSPKSADKKKKRVILMTEYDDARVGSESSEAVVSQMGVLDDPQITEYVREIGRKLLRGVPRRSFQYQFWVVDQVEPNAFALPGGYIFISRGLLALANNEDELACVIGHEITHAAHRHSAAQQGLASRTSPLSMPYRRMAKIAAYGRDMERDADEGGQILCSAAGYDPIGMSTFLRSLAQTERLRIGYSRMPSFMDTHPGSQARASENAVRASEIRWTRDPALGDTRASLLAAIEGLPIGQQPKDGIFRGDRFLHPDLDFQIHFPRGWSKSNSPSAVGAMAPSGQAVVFLTADLPPGDPREVAETFAAKTAEQQKVKIEESKPVKIGRIDAWRMRLNSRGGMGSISAYTTFVPYKGATWRITGVTPAGSAKEYLGRTLSTARSFRPLDDEERGSFYATRLRIATARKGENIDSLNRRTNNDWDVSLTAVHNAIFIDHHFDGGERVKIAVREPYVEEPPPAPSQ